MCYKLTDRPRDVFLRILMLYALVFEVQHTQKDKTSSQLMYVEFQNLDCFSHQINVIS